jgi:hypothetical protein
MYISSLIETGLVVWALLLADRRTNTKLLLILFQTELKYTNRCIVMWSLISAEKENKFTEEITTNASVHIARKAATKN